MKRMRIVTLAVSAVVVVTAAGHGWAGGCWPSAPGTDPRDCPPNDPGYASRWEFRGDLPPEIDQRRMHPAEIELGAIGFSLDRAWQWTIGRDEIVIAVLDSGIRWNNADLVRKHYLNAGELPWPLGAERHDANGDGVFDVTDYDGDIRVGDRDQNGLLDPGDLIAVFSDCRDDDGNGYLDDISGYDFFSGEHCGGGGADNDPADETDFGHGTGIAATAAASTNDGRGEVGICPRCRVLPVRVGDSFVVDANQFARGLVFAVSSGASVVASALGSYDNTPAARRAVEFAWDQGVPLIASAADEYSYHHNYPSLYSHALYVNAIRYNDRDDWRSASTFWGVNPCTNYGARVWVTVPATTCSSGATSRLAGIAGLIQSIALERRGAPLHAEEVYQVLRASADDLDNSDPDWGDLRWPAKAGFDQLYGYGRVNAWAAVQAVAAGRVPAIVELDGPRWFEIVSPRREPKRAITGTLRLPQGVHGRWELGYALGVEPRESDYHAVGAGEFEHAYRGELGLVDFERLPVPAGEAPRSREDRDRYSVTLRLRVIDEAGQLAEARRSFFVLHDPTWKAHFPLDLDCSGEAPPLVTDLDGDGRDEIVLPAADGYVRFLRWTPERLLVERSALDPIEAPELERVNGEPVRDPALRGAVVGPRPDGRGRRVVVASRSGKVYAFDASGQRLAGFPVSIDPPGRASPQRVVEQGILSTPLLADLDGDRREEIVVSALDGRLYAWNGDGSRVAGFPVELVNPRREPGHLDKIVSSPAVGDLDGDGRVEIVVGSNGLRGGFAAAHAVRGLGHRHPAGAYLPGWPVEVPGLRPDLLPTVASGIQMTPQLFDLDRDGDLEVLVYAVTGSGIHVFDHTKEGPRAIGRLSHAAGPGSSVGDLAFLGGTGSASLIDGNGDGRPELYAPMLPLRMLTLRTRPGVPLDVPLALGGWSLDGVGTDAGTHGMLPGWPRRMEDLMVLATPTGADVDGDGKDEVLMGSGGYLLHAFSSRGGEASGFPKFTGGWTFSAPGSGDLDGDGSPEVVSMTREGYLFAWETATAGTGSSLSSPITSQSPARSK